MNVITTSLMIFRIGSTVLFASQYFTSKLASLPRIILESAVLQLVAEVLLLALLAARSDGMYIVLDSITSILVSCSVVLQINRTNTYVTIQGITFNALTIRIKLLSLKEESPDTFSLSIASSTCPPTTGSRRLHHIRSLSQVRRPWERYVNLIIVDNPYLTHVGRGTASQPKCHPYKPFELLTDSEELDGHCHTTLT